MIGLKNLRLTIHMILCVRSLKYEEFANTLKIANQDVEGWGGKMFFVYLPAYERYSDKTPPKEVGDHDKILEIVQQLGITVIDADSVFSDTSAKWTDFFPFGLPGHYSTQGYMAVSKKIMSDLSKVQIQNKP